MYVRSLFISDAHIGSSFCQADALLDILDTYTPKFLYLVGDFIDGWKVKRGFQWPDECNKIIRRIVDLAEEEGTEVRYVVGNHDEFLRKLGPTLFGQISIDNDWPHHLADGRVMRVIHGDYLDCTVKSISWLAKLGDRALSTALWAGQMRNWIQRKIGFKYWSFTNFLKRQIEKALLFINRFETIIVLDTIRRGYSGVICGHIHKPCIESKQGILYCNCGDWVEHGTALVEHHDGRLELVESDKFRKISMLKAGEGFDWPG